MRYTYLYISSQTKHINSMIHPRLLASSAAMALVLSFAFVGAASALTVTCSGAPTATNITWTGSASGGIAPFSFLWGNGSTSTSQTIAVAPGTYSMALEATDASSTVAATSPPPADGLAAQIQALLNQINVLKAQILVLIQQAGGGGTATSTPPFPPGCFVFNKDLKHGDGGDDVRELQRTLASDPSIFPPDLITGFFGPRTEQA